MTEEGSPSEGELEKKLERLLTEQSDLRAEKKNIKSKLEEVRNEKSSRKLKPLSKSGAVGEELEKSLSKNKKAEIVIEERNIDPPLSCADVFLLSGNGAEPIATLERDQSVRSSFLMDFIDNEAELIDSHCHGNGIEHRIWKITGRNMEIFRKIISSSPSKYQMSYWEKHGLKGVKEKIEHLKKFAENPLLIRDLLTRRLGSREIRVSSKFRKNDLSMKTKILRYSRENNLSVDETIVALRMKDDEFSETYEELKNELWKRAESWKDVFAPYFKLRKQFGEVSK